ncbi:MAG: DNA repair protein RecN, partial [Anaerolineae bacterium]|nr:DNA repair protein RecN [Anaerolineae bacterium]
MLEELRIQNFAIIDRLELTFDRGFNVITGETGAGKSIIIDAVDLLLGGKADGSFVRAGADKAVIEGVFALNKTTQAQVIPILRREEMEGDSDEYVTLSREVKGNSRSTARINGVTTSTEVLKSVGSLLVDVHGQSEHLSLLNPRSHIDLLDRYAELTEMRLALSALVDKVNNVRREVKRLTEDEAALKRRAEQLKHEVEEIDAAALRPGEEDELRAERSRMGNSETLATLTAEAYALLHGDDSSDQMSAVDQLGQVSVLLTKLVNIDPKMSEESELADALAEQAEELALTLRKYADEVEYNPERLEEVEERLEVINKLRRRFGATIEAVLEHAERARTELQSIGNSDERLKELRAEEEKLLRLIGEVAERISKVRTLIGQKMSDKIVAELADLRMEKARFEVAIKRTADPDGCFIGDKRYHFTHTGVDDVEFMMSANPGEPLRPLVKVASGGETARIMLALKRVLAQADQTATLIFDEIDTGIGGRVGSVVGEKLWALAATHQVLVVTHLAQLAGYGDKHYHVTKQVKGDRTSTLVTALDDETQRIIELAAMLGTEGESGRLSAQGILAQAETFKDENKPKLAPKRVKVD